VSRHEVHLVPCQSLGARLGPCQTARAGRRPVQERDAKTLRERGSDHGATGAIGCRHGDEPDLSGTHDYLSFRLCRDGGGGLAAIRGENAWSQYQPAYDRSGSEDRGSYPERDRIAVHRPAGLGREAVPVDDQVAG